MLSNRQPLVDPLPAYTQEDMLALLGWREEAQDVVGLLNPQLFTVQSNGADYPKWAEVALNFWREFNAPPRDHFIDLILQVAPEHAHAEAIKILSAARILAERLNVSYLKQRLDVFLHHAGLKNKIVKGLELLTQGRLDDADQILSKPIKRSLREPALNFGVESAELLSKYLQGTDQRFPCGVAQLDKHKIGPGRKEMFLLVAPPKRGKSWGLIHMGKQALLARAKVLHITLEMRSEQVLMRYLQSMTGSPKRTHASTRTPTLIRDAMGRVTSVRFEHMGKREGLVLEGGDLSPTARGRMRMLHSKCDLLVKGFPTRSLTPHDLENYLDELERNERFVPDELVLDYGDLMAIDPANYRVSLGTTFQELRGIADRRNLALVTATQGNRTSSTASVVTEADVAEDFSKVMTADWVVTYSQTAAERRLGLARLFVAAGRDEQDKQMVVIAQNYPLGQFCLESALLPDKWKEILEANGAIEEGGESDAPAH